MEISNQIKQFRSSNNLTQKELRKLLNGSDKTISFISWDSIPGMFRDIMSEEYYPKGDGELTHH